VVVAAVELAVEVELVVLENLNQVVQDAGQPHL
jgi:hypothetical protein